MSQSFRCNLCSAILNVGIFSIPSEVIMDFSIHSQHFRNWFWKYIFALNKYINLAILYSYISLILSILVDLNNQCGHYILSQ